jgi:hypothetical protein
MKCRKIDKRIAGTKLGAFFEDFTKKVIMFDNQRFKSLKISKSNK